MPVMEWEKELAGSQRQYLLKITSWEAEETIVKGEPSP